MSEERRRLEANKAASAAAASATAAAASAAASATAAFHQLANTLFSFSLGRRRMWRW